MNDKPRITAGSDVEVTIGSGSYHNDSDFVARMEKEKQYKNLSTIIISPSIAPIPTRVVSNWSFLRPPNTPCIGPIFLENMEVAEAYNEGLKMILSNPELSKFKYLLTIETDNYPQHPDGLLKLYESLLGAVDGNQYDCVGGLYWTKGEGGMPMCYGDPKATPLNFVPQIPIPNTLTPCNGLGMGFNLWRLDMFKDERFEYGKWFKTVAEYDHEKGARFYTQDLHFFEKAVGLGYKFACDARVPVIHWDEKNRIAW